MLLSADEFSTRHTWNSVQVSAVSLVLWGNDHQ